MGSCLLNVKKSPAMNNSTAKEGSKREGQGSRLSRQEQRREKEVLDREVKIEIERIDKVQDPADFITTKFLEEALKDESKYVKIRREYGRRYPNSSLEAFYLSQVISQKRLDLVKMMLARPETRIDYFNDLGNVFHVAV